MPDQFRGFTDQSFGFFDELSANNNTAWFKANRERYDQHIAGAFKGLLHEIEPFLLHLNPHFETAGKTNRNFSRINRDIRFSKDKSPYKSNYYLYIFDSRHQRGESGRFYVGLTADCVTVGFSIYGGAIMSRRQREERIPRIALESVFRPRVLTHRKLFDRLLQEIVRKGRYETYWHRVEKRDWAQHPGLPRKDEDWQTLMAWVVRKVFLPDSKGIQKLAFARQVERIFSDLFPLYVFTSVQGPRWRQRLTREK